jgi:hypothetical protein
MVELDLMTNQFRDSVSNMNQRVQLTPGIPKACRALITLADEVTAAGNNAGVDPKLMKQTARMFRTTSISRHWECSPNRGTKRSPGRSC